MRTPDRVVDIRLLRAVGFSIRRLASLTGLARTTVERVCVGVQILAALSGPPPRRTRSYAPGVLARLADLRADRRRNGRPFACTHGDEGGGDDASNMA